MIEIRIRGPMELILSAMLSDPAAGHHLSPLGRQTQLGAGRVAALLNQLERAEWVVSSWEGEDQLQGGPRRRVYRFSADGAQLARAAMLEAAQRRVMLPSVRKAPEVLFELLALVSAWAVGRVVDEAARTSH